MKMIFEVNVVRMFTTSKNRKKGKKKTYDEVVDTGVLKSSLTQPWRVETEQSSPQTL